MNDKSKNKSTDMEKTTALYEKLQALLTKLKEEQLTPFKRLVIQNKIDIIQIRLERRISKLDMEEYKQKCEEMKDDRYEEFNEFLSREQEELDAIFDKKEQLDRELEKVLASGKERTAAYREINDAGAPKGLEREDAKKQLFVFEDINALPEDIKNKKLELERINEEKGKKIEEIKEAKEDFLENEKLEDKKNRTELKEYKPSLWKSFKQGFIKVFQNFKEYIHNSKDEKEAIKKAKEEAINTVRAEKAEEQINKNDEMANKFKESIQFHAPAEEISESEIDEIVEGAAKEQEKSLEEKETAEDGEAR